MSCVSEVNVEEPERRRSGLESGYSIVHHQSATIAGTPRCCSPQRLAELKALAVSCFHPPPSSRPAGSPPRLQYHGVRIVADELQAPGGTLCGARANVAGCLECAQGLPSPARV